MGVPRFPERRQITDKLAAAGFWMFRKSP